MDKYYYVTLFVKDGGELSMDSVYSSKDLYYAELRVKKIRGMLRKVYV